METVDAAALLIAENAAFADLIADADLSAPVPTCPEWTLEQLMRHLGRGDRWSAQLVAQIATEAIDPRNVEGGKPPADRAGQITWLREGPGLLIDAVASTGAQTPVWTFLGARPARWWVRRRAHETLVHRADAALAIGVRFDVDAVSAADCITEYLERAVIRAQDPANGERPLGDGESLHLHATDPDLGSAGEWTIVGRSDGIAVTHDHGKSSAAVRGPARALLLALVRRGEADELGLEILGERGVWDTWLARTPF